jgi:hypothetical protein
LNPALRVLGEPAERQHKLFLNGVGLERGSLTVQAVNQRAAEQAVQALLVRELARRGCE